MCHLNPLLATLTLNRCYNLSSSQHQFMMGECWLMVVKLSANPVEFRDLVSSSKRWSSNAFYFQGSAWQVWATRYYWVRYYLDFIYLTFFYYAECSEWSKCCEFTNNFHHSSSFHFLIFRFLLATYPNLQAIQWLARYRALASRRSNALTAVDLL